MNNIDLKKVEILMKLMRKYAINEIAVSDKEVGQSLRLTVQSASSAATVMYAPPPSRMADGLVPTAPSAGRGADDKVGVDSGRTVIRSPFVGTFYGSPSPDAEAFVKVGQKIEKGDVLCIIEAMKLMNEIEADVSGTVVEVLAKNESPVEYDQPLFVLE